MEDYDDYVGFWIKDAPYLWVPGDSPQTSKRFYILHLNAAALFDSENHILDITFIKSALYSNSLDPTETFSLLPIAHKKECGIVRDHFLVWVFTDPEEGKNLDLVNRTIKYPSEGKRDIGKAVKVDIKFPWTDVVDVRVEGRRVSVTPIPRTFEGDWIEIVNPDTNYTAQISIYPWQFGNSHVHTSGGVPGEIIFKPARGKSRTFLNLFKAVEEYNIPISDIRQVHVEALKNTYTSSRESLKDWKDRREIETVNDIANELEKLGEELPGDKWDNRSGWRYGFHPYVPSLRIIYETVIGKRQAYVIRDPNSDGLQLPVVEQIKISRAWAEPKQFTRKPPPVKIPRASPKKKKISPKPRDVKPALPLLNKEMIILTTENIKGKTSTEMGTSYRICFADEPNKRWRSSMEDQAFTSQFGPDVWFFGILDGHGGKKAAEHFMTAIPTALFHNLSKIATTFSLKNVTQAVEKAFLEEDTAWFNKSKDPSGTTFTGILVTPSNLFTINLGDSRTLIRQGDEFFVTKDHKPKDPVELKRIKAAGSFVSAYDGRVGGQLALARALGDRDLKVSPKIGKKSTVYLGANAPVSPIPDVNMYDRVGEEYVLIACDGVFDVMSNIEAMNIFTQNKSCKEVVQEAMKRVTKDNITVLGLKLRPSR